MHVDKLIQLLRCPATGTRLQRRGDNLTSMLGREYRIVNGKPIMVRNPRNIHVRRPAAAITSRNSAEFAVPDGMKKEALVLHLGCGDVPCADPRVVSMDVLPTESADLIAEAESLPFATGTFDLVVSGAVFEHVNDPMTAAVEMRRVVREGGSIYVDTAFLQGYHGFPSHFFNMTPQAVETHLVDDFILDGSIVPDSGTVAHTIASTFGRYLDLIPEEMAAEMRGMTVGEALTLLGSDYSRRNRWVAPLSEYSHRALAASFVVRATKPAGYESRHRPLDDHDEDDRERTARREYYAARMAVIQRHHEADRMAGDGVGVALQDILDAGRVMPPMDIKAFKAATLILTGWEAALEAHRDGRPVAA